MFAVPKLPTNTTRKSAAKVQENSSTMTYDISSQMKRSVSDQATTKASIFALPTTPIRKGAEAQPIANATFVVDTQPEIEAMEVDDVTFTSEKAVEENDAASAPSKETPRRPSKGRRSSIHVPPMPNDTTDSFAATAEKQKPNQVVDSTLLWTDSMLMADDDPIKGLANRKNHLDAYEVKLQDELQEWEHLIHVSETRVEKAKQTADEPLRLNPQTKSTMANFDEILKGGDKRPSRTVQSLVGKFLDKHDTSKDKRKIAELKAQCAVAEQKLQAGIQKRDALKNLLEQVRPTKEDIERNLALWTEVGDWAKKTLEAPQPKRRTMLTF